MGKYLERFNEIDQDYKDISEYYNFYTHCQGILNTTDINMEKQLLLGLYEFTNETVLQITYKLLREFYPLAIIEKITLYKHIKIFSLKGEIYKYLITHYDSSFEELLMKDLYNSAFCSNHLFTLIFKFCGGLFDNFLNTKSEKYAFNQIQAMLVTKKVINIAYYVKFLGHENSFLCSRARDLIVLAMEEGVICDMVIFEDSFISLKKPIYVNSASNFLFYSNKLIKEGVSIKKLYRENNVECLSQILRKYIDYEESIVCNKNLYHKFLDTSSKSIHQPKNLIGDQNFDFLFGSQNYKSFTDCIEI